MKNVYDNKSYYNTIKDLMDAYIFFENVIIVIWLMLLKIISLKYYSFIHSVKVEKWIDLIDEQNEFFKEKKQTTNFETFELKHKDKNMPRIEEYANMKIIIRFDWIQSIRIRSNRM